MTTVRVRFSKTGEASYISLLDLQRVFQRAFKRSHLPVWYTQGFNPHIYMTFAAPLPLGQESLAECMDFKSESDAFDWSEACGALSECLPSGIDVLRMAHAEMDTGEIAFARYEIRYPAGESARAARAYSTFEARACVPVEKRGKRTVRTIDLKQHAEIESAKVTDKGFCMALFLPAGGELTLNPALLTSCFEEYSGLPQVRASILRTALYTKKKEIFV